MSDQLEFSWNGRGTIDERCELFHANNPDVYDELVRLSRRWRNRNPGSKCGIAMLWEVLRWRRGMRTQGDEYKLNNDYRAPYARKIMAENPDLDGLFDIRARHTP